MKRLFRHVTVRLTMLVMVGVVFILSGCATPKSEGFAIYLTRLGISPDRMEVLSHVDIEEQPVITTSDIVSYNARTHEITLDSNTYERVSRLEVPVRGRSFVVCVDRKPIYWGAFWTPLSSISFSGVTIIRPLSSRGTKVIKIELGYPSPSFYEGQDPRLNAEVVKSLERAGKLK